jgi:hypothetical protein
MRYSKKMLLSFQLILIYLLRVGRQKAFTDPKRNSLRLNQLTKKGQSHSRGTYSTKKLKALSEGLKIPTKPDLPLKVNLQVMKCLTSTLKSQL